ncbi:hypothetical protein HBI46_173970 [Parastagonospora nodorum]|nr:hypothetical protein HBI46_173970 [Parastagonospora nodorum]
MSSMCAEEPGPLRYLDNGLLDVTPTEEYVAITEINAQVSPLLQLPAELRDQIWHYVLKDHIIRPLPNRLQNLLRKYELAMKEKFPGFKRPSEHRFSLLLVSRQVYAETGILPYKLSTFVFLGAAWVSHWTATMSLRASKLLELIRFVRVTHVRLGRPLMSIFREGFGSLEKINVQLMPRTRSEIVFSLDTETMEWAKAHEIELNMSTCTFEEMMNRWLAGLE